MYENDYIIRMINEMAAMVARILFSRRTANYQAALLEIDNAYETLLRIDPDTARDLPVDDVARFVRLRNSDNPDFGIAFATLLYEEAATIEARDGFTERTLTLYEKSLISFVATVTDGARTYPDDFTKSMDEIVSRIAEYPCTDTTTMALSRYHEWKGAYGKAEDLLYLLESEGLPNAEAEILRFYQGLMTKSDSELRNGNLPREEIEQAMQERHLL